MLLVSTTPPPLPQIPVRISPMEDERGNQSQSLVKENSGITNNSILRNCEPNLEIEGSRIFHLMPRVT